MIIKNQNAVSLKTNYLLQICAEISPNILLIFLFFISFSSSLLPQLLLSGFLSENLQQWVQRSTHTHKEKPTIHHSVSLLCVHLKLIAS